MTWAITGYYLALILNGQPATPPEILAHFGESKERACNLAADEINKEIHKTGSKEAKAAGLEAVCLRIQRGPQS